MEYQPDEQEQQVLNVLREERRANPMLIRERTGLRKEYVSRALTGLAKAGVVEKVERGLYDHVPEKDGEVSHDLADPRTERDRLQDALAECRSERDDLQAALDDCREQLAAADGADHEAIQRATADIEAALERADGQAIETAVQEIRDALARLEDDDTDG
jgi:chromosome segregation ATPase